MLLIARIIGVSLLVAGLGAGLGGALVWPIPGWPGISFWFAWLAGTIGAIVGAIAGAAREIVDARRQPPSSGENLPR